MVRVPPALARIYPARAPTPPDRIHPRAATDHARADTAGQAAPLIISAETAAVRTHPEFDPGLLTAEEAERAARFHFDADRRDFVSAHVLLRVCAGRFLGESASRLTVVQRCPTCGGPHGKPSLADHPELELSLSHTRGEVVAVAGAGPVGVDIERTDRHEADPALLERTLAPAERAAVASAADPRLAFLRLWVRKEALIKVGAASLDRLDEVDLSELPLDPPDSGAGSPRRFGEWHLLDWHDTERQVVGAAVATDPPRLTTLATT